MSLPSGNDPRPAEPVAGTTSLPVSGKRELRNDLIRARLAIDGGLRAKWDARIGKHILECLQARPVASLGVYWPIRNEPDLHELYAKLLAQGVLLALPLVVEKDSPLEFAAWKPGDALVEESFGIKVPVNRTRVALPEALLAPCVGFNSARYRLGYGGGFFDRTLATTPRPLSLGVAYSCLETNFAVEEYDIPLDCIVTESAILR
jgi:5,10-methenyltetrahydrofolate synthetase